MILPDDDDRRWPPWLQELWSDGGRLSREEAIAARNKAIAETKARHQRGEEWRAQRTKEEHEAWLKSKFALPASKTALK